MNPIEPMDDAFGRPLKIGDVVAFARKQKQFESRPYICIGVLVSVNVAMKQPYVREYGTSPHGGYFVRAAHPINPARCLVIPFDTIPAEVQTAFRAKFPEYFPTPETQPVSE